LFRNPQHERTERFLERITRLHGEIE